jgi:UDP-N-acetyl-alpha-D-quinovosamine dehydrogenase
MTDIQNRLVLITGANGFVGRPLCEEMLRQGWRIRAAIRSSIQMPNGVETAEVDDIDGDTDWTSALRGVDIVIHLAARVHIMKDAAADPLAEFLKVNLHGTKNLAQQAAHAGIKRLVYVSSIKVNGEETHDQCNFTEEDMPAPQHPYGISKWQAEQALRRIAQESDLQVVIVRPPLVYGPGVKGNFNSLMAAIDKGIPLPLASAHNIRSQVYVGNLVSALITCAIHPVAAGQTYLVRDSENISTALLVKKISVALGRNNRSFYFPEKLLRIVAAALGRADQIDRLFGSLRVSDEKLCGELGWIPPYTLEQGLGATAAWYHQNAKQFILTSKDLPTDT